MGKLEEVESPINGKITVVKSLGFGTYITSQGLTQSGGIVEDIWRSTLRKLTSAAGYSSQNSNVKSCLILGLGGGSAALLVRKFWPKAKITGVDIDPMMVELGTRHLGLGDSRTKVVIEDAYDFITQSSKLKSQSYSSNLKTYDLVLVDLYVGHDVPEKFQTEKFLKLILRLLTDRGIAVFNRLYFGEKRPEAMKFGRKLEKLFTKVDWFYPEANLMLLCYNR